MREFAPIMVQYLALEALKLCYLFELTLKNGETLYYTDSSESLVIPTPDGLKVFRADPGIEVSAIRDTEASFNQTATIEVGYRSDMLTEEMVRRGDLDGATHKVSLYDYDRILAAELFSGYIDRVTASNPYSCSLDLTGWQVNSTQTNGVYSIKCRNIFCDEGCTLDIENYSFPFTVAGNPGENVPDPQTIGTGIFNDEAFFQFGNILWTKGRNTGNLTPIAYSADGMMALTVSPPYIPQGGDEGIARAGCDFYAETCKDRYNNIKNFEGEPAVPTGVDTKAPAPVDSTETTGSLDPAAPVRRPDPVYTASTSYPTFA